MPEDKGMTQFLTPPRRDSPTQVAPSVAEKRGSQDWDEPAYEEIDLSPVKSDGPPPTKRFRKSSPVKASFDSLNLEGCGVEPRRPPRFACAEFGVPQDVFPFQDDPYVRDIILRARCIRLDQALPSP